MESALKSAHFERQMRRQRVKGSYTFAEVVVEYWAKVGEELGSTVWASALDLCEFITRHRDLFKDKRVLELGAGLGLPGILASYFSDRVDLTDKQCLLNYLSDNILLNSRSNTFAYELAWGTPSSELQRTYDIVIGADIVYADNGLPQLIASLLTYTSSGSVFFLAYRPRVPDQENLFFSSLEPYFVLRDSEDYRNSRLMWYERVEPQRKSPM